MKITSDSFKSNGNIPSKFTCDGDNVNPNLRFEDIAENSKSLVLIMDYPDAVPVAGFVWEHWLVWNIDPNTEEISENSVPREAVEGRNSRGKNSYGGPCPPDKEHRYYFRLYALDTVLDISRNSQKKDIESAMKGQIIDRAELVGKYKRK